MSNPMSSIPAGLVVAAALISLSAADAQLPSSGVTAPVPRQILTARRVFISNAGSESYGSQSYFRLTRYDGGPDRFYNQFYSAIKEAGRYELADSPADADIVFEARFTSPIVDKQTQYDLVYDPQLNVTVLDPKTRVAFWSLTEHIQPARDRERDNRNFDQAVARLVERTRMLASGSVASTDAGPQTIVDLAPVGAVESARFQEHWQHTVAGSLIGSVAGSLIAWATIHSSCGGGLSCATVEGIASERATFNKRFRIALGSTVTGAVIGWIWPTH
jgi:hypothetical protein